MMDKLRFIRITVPVNEEQFQRLRKLTEWVNRQRKLDGHPPESEEELFSGIMLTGISHDIDDRLKLLEQLERDSHV